MWGCNSSSSRQPIKLLFPWSQLLLQLKEAEAEARMGGLRGGVHREPRVYEGLLQNHIYSLFVCAYLILSVDIYLVCYHFLNFGVGKIGTLDK